MTDRSPRLAPIDIHAAADGLLRETQEMPTDRAVLDRLGRGSLTTINRAMAQWRSDKAARLLDMAQPDVPEPVLSLARQMWSHANDAAMARAHQQLAEREAALDLQRRAFEGEAESLRLRAGNAEALLEVEQRERTRVEREAELSTRELGESKQRATELAGRCASLEAEASSKERQLLEAQDRERALKQQQERLEVQHRTESTMARERHESEVRLHVERTEDQRSRADRAEAAAAKAAQRYEARAALLETRAADAERSRNEISAQLSALQRQLDGIGAERDTWRARAEERDASIVLLQRTVEDLRQLQAQSPPAMPKRKAASRVATESVATATSRNQLDQVQLFSKEQ